MAPSSPDRSERADPPGGPRRGRRHHEPRRQRHARARRARRAASCSTSCPARPAIPPPCATASSWPRATGDDEWIWLLHDDSNPAPTALAELLDAAARAPRGRDPRPQAARVALAAPPPRGRPDHHRHRAPRDRSGAGRVRPGPARRGARGARGQHRRACSCAARVLESLGGLDEDLPIFGNDIDFGWRAALAGHRTLVVPQAVVFHAEAAHRGIRRTPLTGRHTHYQERRAALLTSLANVSSRGFAWQYVRLFLGSLLRVVGFLVVRSVGEALDELAAVLSVHGRPRQLLAARRERADAAAGRPRRRTPPAGADVAALPPRPRLRHRPRLGRHQPGRRRRRAAPPRQGRGRARRRAGRARGATRVRDVGGRRRGRLPHRLRHRRPLLHQPGRRGAGALRRPVAARRPRGLRLDHRRRAVAGAGRRGGLVAPARLDAGTRSAPAPTCRPRPTCCRSRSPRPSCSATPEPSCPASCCSPSRWRRGARGGCSRSSDGSSTRWGCRAGWWCGVR